MIAMIWSLFALALFAYAYENSKVKDYSHNLMMWTCIIMGALLMANDIYVSVVLPWQIAGMWNDGYGITYNSTTQFNKYDERVAYFMAQTSNEWMFLEWGKFASILMGGIFVVLFLWNAMSNYTASSITGKRDNK